MRVEVLYVAECPSHPAAVKLVKGVLAAAGVVADVREVLVTDERMARELRFRGSPTIRINGRDIAGEPQKAETFTLSCRLYPGSKPIGVPPAEIIHRAVVEAREENKPMKQGSGISASLGAVVSSIAAIGCCLPLGFAAALGVASASAFFATLRPWLLGLSVALLGVGFWQQHRAAQCVVRGRLLGKVLLWAALAVVLGMILFPQQIAGFIANRF